MARKSKQTTQDKLNNVLTRIEEQKQILKELELEKTELLEQKKQEDKNELYDLIMSKEMTVEKAKELISKVKVQQAS